MTMTHRKPGAFLAIGIAAGTAIGVATHDLAPWLAVGTALGAAATVAARRRGAR